MYRRKNKAMALTILTALLVTGVATPVLADSYGTDSERSAMGMCGDFLLLRPVGFAATVIGAGVFVLSLPWSLLGRNVDEAAQKLVVEPAKFTFTRPLGDLPDGGGF